MKTEKQIKSMLCSLHYQLPLLAMGEKPGIPTLAETHIKAQIAALEWALGLSGVAYDVDKLED